MQPPQPQPQPLRQPQLPPPPPQFMAAQPQAQQLPYAPMAPQAQPVVQQQPRPPPQPLQPQPPTTYFAPPPPTWLYVSRTGKILYASQAFLAASGYRSLAGSPLRLLFGQETCGETVRALAASMSRAAPVRMLLALYCSAGATVA